jgi:hypothetical protein
VWRVRAECLDWLLIVGRSHWRRSSRSTLSTITDTVRTERSGCKRQTDSLTRRWSVRISRAGCVDTSRSVVFCTGTDELHDHLYAPFILPG